MTTSRRDGTDTRRLSPNNGISNVTVELSREVAIQIGTLNNNNNKNKRKRKVDYSYFALFVFILCVCMYVGM